jgi:hypothetical protein
VIGTAAAVLIPTVGMVVAFGAHHWRAHDQCHREYPSGHVTDIRDFDVPGGPLQDGLFCLTQQGGIDAAWSTVNDNRPRSALKGRMTVRQAFEEWLRGTGISINPEYSSDALLVLEPASSQTTTGARQLK